MLFLVMSSWSIFFLSLLAVIPAEEVDNVEKSFQDGAGVSTDNRPDKGNGISIAITSDGDPRKLGQVDSAIDGKWQQFRHWSIGSQALTCGTSCIAGLNSEFAPPAPWEFELPASGGCFIVVDAFEADNQYNVTDFENTTIGVTSEPTTNESCGKDPDTCYDASGVSNGSFYLHEGPHSVMITVNQGSPGSAFFRITTDTSSCRSTDGSSEPPTPLSSPGSSPGPTPPSTVSLAPTSPLDFTPAPTTQASMNSPQPPIHPPGSQNRPPIAKCKESVTLPARNVCATCVDIDNGSYDPDDGDTIETVQNPWGPYIVGTRNVTLVVTDAAGESDSCVTQVTVEDSEELDLDSIECGVPDWHVQPCDAPLSFSASYNQSAAYKPNAKANGCPVVVAVNANSSSLACERCVAATDTNTTESFDCKNVVSVTERGISLAQSNEFGFFLSWEVIATDEGGRSLTKRCGVCVGSPDSAECRRMSAYAQPNHLKRRQAAANECPEQLPSSSDGSRRWPEYTLAEIDNCAAILN